MKKFIAILLACLMVIPAACADGIDLSSLSFDELRTLQAKISQELTTRPEWKEVPVPPGFYQVGVDIPAGRWCLKCGNSSLGYVSVRYGENINESGTGLKMPWFFGDMICQKGDGTHLEFVNITLTEGCYLLVEYGQVIFTTPEKTDLGF